MPPQHKRRAAGFLACAIASSLWGCGFFFGKIALAEMGFAHMVLYRFFFAAMAFLPMLLLHRVKMPRRDWILMLLGAFLGVPVQFLVQFKGLSLTTVAHASLMVGTMPVILAIGAAIFAHERMDRIAKLQILKASASLAAMLAAIIITGSPVAGIVALAAAYTLTLAFDYRTVRLELPRSAWKPSTNTSRSVMRESPHCWSRSTAWRARSASP